MVLFGCVVCGPPGAGKSTMCAGLARYYELMKRPCAVVNLDPACEASLTPFTIDVRNLCSVDSVMEEQGLGANGALMYCMAAIRASDWLVQRLRELTDGYSAPYVVFDLPGQVELWTHSGDLRAILDAIVKSFDARLVVAHVVDANHCTVPTSFVSAALVSLMAMLRLELPHVNVLSKCDQLTKFQDAMPFTLDYFADAKQLDRLLPYCTPGTLSVPALTETIPEEEEQPRQDDRYRGIQSLTAKICELVEDFGLVVYQKLDISDGTSVASLVRILDKANGHPAGIYNPATLLDDASRLFLGVEDPPPEKDASLGLPRTDGLRQYRTHAPPPSSHHAPAQDEDDAPFSWYRRRR